MYRAVADPLGRVLCATAQEGYLFSARFFFFPSLLSSFALAAAKKPSTLRMSTVAWVGLMLR